jgi:hypothetical protein
MKFVTGCMVLKYLVGHILLLRVLQMFTGQGLFLVHFHVQPNVVNCRQRKNFRSKQRSRPSLLLAVASEVRFSRSKDYESISSHEPGEAPDTLFFHPEGKNRPNRAPGSSISPGFGPSSIRRAQAIPGLPGRARGLRTKEMRAKRQRNFSRVVWP